MLLDRKRQAGASSARSPLSVSGVGLSPWFFRASARHQLFPVNFSHRGRRQRLGANSLRKNDFLRGLPLAWGMLPVACTVVGLSSRLAE
jgi:hypothetical protein